MQTAAHLRMRNIRKIRSVERYVTPDRPTESGHSGLDHRFVQLLQQRIDIALPGYPVPQRLLQPSLAGPALA